MSPHHAPALRPASQAPFRRSPIAALATMIAFMALGPAHAQNAEPSVADLQAEITRLKQALAAAQGAPTAVPPTPAADTPTPAPAAQADAAGTAASGQQEQQLETVVVRSRNRIERVQDVPLSVSVIGGRELERELALDIGAITKRAANVVRNTGNSRTYSLSIRGVGKVSQVEAQDASVGMILDGVSYAYAPLGSFDFYDVESVEVARGPQGTLLGKNTTMGVINVTTRKPSFTPDANWSLTLGQRNTVIAQFAGGGPVIDDLLAFRGAVTVNKGAGPYANAYNHDETYFNRDRVAGRVQFLLTPSPDFSARASIEIQPKSGEYYNGLTVKQQVPSQYRNGATTGNTALDVQGKLGRDWFTNQSSYRYDTDYLGNLYPNNDNQRALQTSTNGASLELKWNLGSHDLTSITAYRDYHFHARNDSDATPFDVQLNGGGKNDAYRQRSQEIRLSSKPGGFVDYQVGALWFANSVDFGKDGGWNAGWGTDAGAWFANNEQYAVLNADAAGRLLMVNSLKGLNKASTQSVKNKSIGIYGQADWHLTEQTTLTTGLRFTHENRQNSGSNYIAADGAGVGLNPVSGVNGFVLGGFDTVVFADSKTKVVNTTTGGQLTSANTAEQLSLADTVANRYFGATITSTPGAAYNSLTQPQKLQIAAAKAIRSDQLGKLWALVKAEGFRKTQPNFVISPTYKINEDNTTYASLQYGEKGGAVQIVDGKSFVAKPEKVTSYEVGLKSAFLNKSLFVNTALFFTNVKDYQQPVTEIDQASNSTVNYTGNAPKVEVKGLEIDGSYTGFKNITLRFAGAYTDAKFKEFATSPQPAENNNASVKFTDLSGQALTGAAKYTFNVGADYRRPVFGDKTFHTSFNTAYSSKFNSDAALSTYAWIPSNWKTDFSIGLGRRDNGFDVSLIVKNLFNDDTPQVQTWNSYTPGEPRWFGIQISGKL
ncbi:TonB-dependent receptor [Aquabacterium soli]|nr:TonB-dependent receptor [Aquabacterium soli]